MSNVLILSVSCIVECRRVSSCSAFSTNLTDSSAAFLIDPVIYARIEEEFDWIRFQVCRLSNDPPEYFGCDEGEVTFSPAPASASSAPTFTPAPSREEIPVLVAVKLDAYGYETGWKIQDDNGFVFAQVLKGYSSIDQSNSIVSKVVSLPRGVEFNFILLDSYGDGFDGRVVLYLGDEANNNKILGYCDASLDGGSDSFTTIFSFAFQAGEDGIIHNVFSIGQPSGIQPTVSIRPSVSIQPSGSIQPSVSPSSSPAPSREEIPVLVSLELDTYGYETGWKIQDDKGFVVAQVLENIYRSYSSVSEIVSLPRDVEFNFVLSDSHGDGFDGRLVLYLGDEANNNKILGYYDASLEGGSDSFGNIYSFAFQAGEDGIIHNVFPTDQLSRIQPTVSIQPLVSIQPSGSIQPSVSPSFAPASNAQQNASIKLSACMAFFVSFDIFSFV